MRFFFDVKKYGSRCYHMEWKIEANHMNSIGAVSEGDRKARIMKSYDRQIDELERAAAELKAKRSKVLAAIEELP